MISLFVMLPIFSLITARTLSDFELPERVSTFVLAESLNAKLITGDAGLRTLSEKLGVEVHGLIWFINELFEEKKYRFETSKVLL